MKNKIFAKFSIMTMTFALIAALAFAQVEAEIVIKGTSVSIGVAANKADSLIPSGSLDAFAGEDLIRAVESTTLRFARKP